MRNLLFCLPILLVACGGDGADFAPAVPEPEPLPFVQHAPVITAVGLSPETAKHMEGNGSVTVTAELVVRDTGLDVQTLFVLLPDGRTLEFAEAVTTVAGEITEQFALSTESIGVFTVEFWVDDTFGNSSTHERTQFLVVGEVQTGAWTQRLGGLPYLLNDVIWDGSVFIAVGDGGAILTSVDGIDWATRDSTTDSSLGAVAAYGRDIFAVGYEIVLHSTDHGENWAVKYEPAYAGLNAVAVTSSQVVVAGNAPDLFLPRVMVSSDRGETWQEASYPWGYFFGFFGDVIYRDGVYVAATHTLYSGGRAMTSSDGLVWDEVFYDDESGFVAIVHDGSQYIVAGGNGAVFTSFDGFNWTKTQIPVLDVDYLSGAWNGSKVVIAGGYSWRLYSRRIVPQVEVPVGISSTDGGATWEVFNIDGLYQSLGMAYGNGRFVSVGQSTPISGSGAIYTSE